VIQRRYKRSIAIVEKAWRDAGYAELPPEVISTGAHAVFIEANRQRV
jgi:hypothetical protein